MQINLILNKHFNPAKNTTISVFDCDNIYTVYKEAIINMGAFKEISKSVLNHLAYCLYEVMDNVITHSNKKHGVLAYQYDETQNSIRIVVADNGQGIRQSLSATPIYQDLTEEKALRLCLQNKVSDGNGQGFGLFSTQQFVNAAGGHLSITSGFHNITYCQDSVTVSQTEFWQGTIVSLCIKAGVSVPDNVLADFTDVKSQYDILFENDNLW